ncbi:hypothetical protein [Methylobacter sp.]|uniref:hypothetical protein n=1 Tax=Methylobacter sp. TaxID=2051955 RepID=UPI002486D5A3|nr:hypothetical protein [Methylobacter sp.]MDI1277081.1 hypothetical protein [Methylobacter sp.]
MNADKNRASLLEMLSQLSAAGRAVRALEELGAHGTPYGSVSLSSHKVSIHQLEIE